MNTVCILNVTKYLYFKYFKPDGSDLSQKKLTLIPCTVINCYQLPRRYDVHSLFLYHKMIQIRTINMEN